MESEWTYPWAKACPFLRQVLAGWPASVPACQPAVGVSILNEGFNHVCHLPQPLKRLCFLRTKSNFLCGFASPVSPGFCQTVQISWFLLPAFSFPDPHPFTRRCPSNSCTPCPPAPSTLSAFQVLTSTMRSPSGLQICHSFLLEHSPALLCLADQTLGLLGSQLNHFVQKVPLAPQPGLAPMLCPLLVPSTSSLFTGYHPSCIVGLLCLPQLNCRRLEGRDCVHYPHC